MGWRVGDRLGLATTSRGESTVHRVAGLGPNKVTLIEPLSHEHWGGFREIEGRQFELAAEVVNLERSVVITGDHDDFEATMEGLHVIMTGSGYMDLRYTRVEYCGQRPIMGRYCLHFHMMKKCPRCVFQGNAVVEGQHVGITVHGTHQSLVDQNVIWDARANGLYTEDGNEMNNTLSRNVMICTDWTKCSVDWVSGNFAQTAGIFLIGMTNNVLENRIIGYENGIWTPGSFRGVGRGAAEGKVCPQHYPFGEWRGNTCHDCQRFGLYLDNQYPRNVEVDEDGYVTDKASCEAFTDDGRDNGVVREIRDEFNWHNMFVGQYAIGDLQFVNYTSVNNAHAMYWKQSKNFADGRLWHMRDSTFAHDPNDNYGQLKVLGPAGPFTFGMKDSVFLGGSRGGSTAVAAGQNCALGGGGGPCTVQYLFENVDFSRLRADQPRIKFGASTTGGQAFVLPMFVAKDNSLGGFRSIVSGHLNGFGQVPPGCQQLGSEWTQSPGGALGCAGLVRRLNLWGPDSGRLQLAGPGYQVPPNWDFPTEGRNAGELWYDDRHGGYGAPVVTGQSYSLSGALQSDTIVEFSDGILADYFGASESVWLEVGGATCELKASDDRSFISTMGRESCGSYCGSPFRTSARHHVIRGGRLNCGDLTAPATTTTTTTSRDPSLAECCAGCDGGFCSPGSGSCYATQAKDYYESCSQPSPSPAPVPTTTTQPSPSPAPVPTTTTAATTPAPGGELAPCCAGCVGGFCSPISNSCYATQVKDYYKSCFQPLSPAPSPTPVPVPSTGSVTWIFHPALNCWDGFGASAIVPDPLDGVFTLESCKSECVSRPECVAFVIRSNLADGSSPCWLRQGLVSQECQVVSDFNTWEISRGTSSTSPASTTVTTTPPMVTSSIATTLPTTTVSTTSRSVVPSTGSVTWILYPALNCWGGQHGATPIAGVADPLDGVFTLESCKSECASRPACVAFVIRSNLADGSSPCWLRQRLVSQECQVVSDFNTWEISRGTSNTSPASTTVTTTPPMVTSSIATTLPTTTVSTTSRSVVPSTGSVTWILYPALNCWGGQHGATPIEGVADPLDGVFTLESCKSECASRPACVAFVIRSNLPDGSSPCWLRQRLVSQECQVVSDFNTWEISRDANSESSASTTASITTTTMVIITTTMATSFVATTLPTTSVSTTSRSVVPSTGSVTWILYPALNCWGGQHGATPIAGVAEPLDGVFTLESCKSECASRPACVAFVIRSNLPDGSSPCWLRQRLVSQECQVVSDFNTWEISRGTSTATA
ncbi:unnamed protein product [Polarella glacialis]|uniref:G8 domain-containing protein n=1 Tax=Polarella glacialis TaxID=89957 RepID=A0A813EUJ6_POLGL|nr:unnamed protein product [Polarella glacialis]